MKLRILPLLLTVLLFAGCVTPPPPQQAVSASFSPDEFAAYSANGTAKISGQAFMRTRGGEVRFGAGSLVNLTPATAYVKEVRAIRSSGKIPIGHDDSKTKVIAASQRSTVADGNGNFEFTDLPAGEYLVETEIWWEFFNGHYQQRTGGLLFKFAAVKDGESLKVMLSE